MARKRRDEGIALPWENRGNPIGQWLAGARRRAIVVSVVLVALVVGLVRAIERRDAERETRLAVVEVERAVHRFKTDHGRCPRSLDELIHPPRSGARYLRAIPRDGWGEPLLVRCPGLFDPDSVDVVAAGRRGSFFDDDFPH